MAWIKSELTATVNPGLDIVSLDDEIEDSENDPRIPANAAPANAKKDELAEDEEPDANSKEPVNLDAARAKKAGTASGSQSKAGKVVEKVRNKVAGEADPASQNGTVASLKLKPVAITNGDRAVIILAAASGGLFFVCWAWWVFSVQTTVGALRWAGWDMILTLPVFDIRLDTAYMVTPLVTAFQLAYMPPLWSVKGTINYFRKDPYMGGAWLTLTLFAIGTTFFGMLLGVSAKFALSAQQIQAVIVLVLFASAAVEYGVEPFARKFIVEILDAVRVLLK